MTSDMPSSRSMPIHDSGDASNIAMNEPIAIIGLSLRFPGDADSVESFWDMMLDARCTVSGIPSTRFNRDTFCSSDPDAPGTIRSKNAHFLKGDISVFDAAFFNTTDAEAIATDPQQRIILETAYHAFENAGITLADVYGQDISVHAGSFTNDYLMLQSKDPETMPKYTATGVSGAMVSGRISTFFNLKGPSVTIDTACSSSLVAFDQACQNLRLNKTCMGVVVGSNLLYSMELSIALSTMGFLSPDGLSHSFDSRANGYARGEGFGAVIIKRLSDAIRDNDTIRAVVRASGVNQDGDTPLAQPSKESQTRLIAETYRNAGLDTSLTRYVEAHGTGTAMGDPIEANAIGSALGAGTSKHGPVYIGSLKAGFGHLEGAAGIAGVIKAVLVLERAIIPPLVGLKEVNPEIDSELLNIEFPRIPVPWPSHGLRRVSVNSFGFAGTNAHVVLDDAYNYMQEHGLNGKHATTVLPPLSDDADSAKTSKMSNSEHLQRPTILLWTAFDRSSLEEMTSRYQNWFLNAIGTQNPGDLLPSLSYTLLRRRSNFSWRSYAVVYPNGREIADISEPSKASSISDLSLAFVFTGQGAQWYGMAKELFSYEVFEKSILESISYLEGLGCSHHLLGALIGELEDQGKLDEPSFAQPISTVLQVALVDLMVSINVIPSVVVGHSSGEIAAAYACGAINRESAWKLAYYRGVCSSRLAVSGEKSGAMLSANLSEQEAVWYMQHAGDLLGHEGDLSIACINSPTNVTISGRASHIRNIADLMEKSNVFARILRIPVAYHGPHMEAVADEYHRLIGCIESGVASNRHINMVSSVTGERIEPFELQDPLYWVRNLVSPVKFMHAIQNVFSKPKPDLSPRIDLSHRKLFWASDILEIGPHSTLSGPIRDCLKPLLNARTVKYLSLLTRKQDACVTVMHATAQIYCKGYPAEIQKLVWLDKGNAKVTCLPTLPQYPFNHSKSFWCEPENSRNLRFRTHGPNIYLGTPVTEYGPHGSHWRLVLNPLNSTWISDHKIDSDIIYPGAGMLTMAIEAAAQLAGSANISAFEIEDVSFEGVVKISEGSSGATVQLQMHQTSAQTGTKMAQYSFSLSNYHSKKWSEVCRGMIRASLETTPNEVDMSNEDGHRADRARSWFDDIAKRCNKVEIDGAELYPRVRKFGYNFGPAFHRIRRSKLSMANEAMTEVGIFEVPARDAPTVVHPATLDGILQAVFPVLHQAFEKGEQNTLVPTRISRLWLSHEGLLSSRMGSLNVATRCQRYGPRKSVMKAAAFSEQALKAFLEGVEFTSIADNIADRSTAKKIPRYLCWKVENKPDVEKMDRDQLQSYLTKDAPILSLSPLFYRGLRMDIHRYLQETFNRLVKSGHTQFEAHLQHYHDWMVRELNTAPTIQLEPRSLNGVLTGDEKNLSESQKKIARVFSTTGQNLFNILTNQVDPLSLLFQDNILDDCYKEQVGTANYLTPLSRYLELVSHKNPSIKILEIGAGTGGATKHMLRTLTQPGSNGRTARYSEYYFTDISPSFFAKAKEELAAYPKINYTTLNIESNPLTQGFTAASFDIVIASLVLHATRNIEQTLSHVHTLLKPGGKLLLIEIVTPEEPSSGFVFGLLSGWWLSQDGLRKQRMNPCLTGDEWSQSLLGNGFGGVEHIFYDSEDMITRRTALLISTKGKSCRLPARSEIRTCTLAPVDEDSSHTVSAFERQLHELSVSVRKISPNAVPEIRDPKKELLVVIDSNTESVLINLSSQRYAWLHKILTISRRILWVLPGNPTAGPVYGLARALLSEDPSLRFTIFETPNRTEEWNINKVLKQSLAKNSASMIEPELFEQGGLIFAPRIFENAHLNKSIYEYSLPAVRRSIRFRENHFQLTIETPGLLDSLTFVQSPAPPPTPKRGEVEIRVVAVGVNFKDCLVALGRIPEDTFGTEFSGVVTQCNPGCQFQPGDRVMGCATNTFRPILHCNETTIVKIPEGISFTEAAKIPTNFVTAHHALIEIGRLASTETVLIHAAAGGTGQAAVQIAQSVGAEIYATVGSAKKKKLLVEMYGVLEDHIFYSRDSSFAQGIKDRTSGRGVDVVLNSLAGDELRNSWEIIAPYGRFLEIGKRDILSHEKMSMFPFLQNVSFAAIDIVALAKDRPQVVQKALTAVAHLFTMKRINLAKPLKRFQVNEVEEAFRYLQNGTNPGVVAVEVDEEAAVPALVPPSLHEIFDPEATYVIAGGLGGQGRSIAKWMVDKGARALLLLSRKGNATHHIADFLTELQEAGVHIETPVCDISDEVCLKQVLQTAAITMPPIKGCIQSAMVLRDATFPSMTYDDWKVATDPKIKGSWNLHTLLPSDLDFFIFLSSMGGVIGSAGQSNYAAGNTFQDKLSAHRLSCGQKTVSLNLGVMVEEGYVASLKDAEARTILRQIMPISQAELFAILEYYCDRNLNIENMESQVVMGLPLPQDLRNAGEYPPWMDRPVLSSIHQIESASTTVAQTSISTSNNLSKILLSKSDPEVRTLLINAIRDTLARVLSRPPDSIDTGKPMHTLGVDSLVAVELRNWFSKSGKVDVPIFGILGGTIEGLAISVLEKMNTNNEE